MNLTKLIQIDKYNQKARRVLMWWNLAISGMLMYAGTHFISYDLTFSDFGYDGLAGVDWGFGVFTSLSALMTLPMVMVLYYGFRRFTNPFIDSGFSILATVLSAIGSVLAVVEFQMYFDNIAINGSLMDVTRFLMVAHSKSLVIFVSFAIYYLIYRSVYEIEKQKLDIEENKKQESATDENMG